MLASLLEPDIYHSFVCKPSPIYVWKDNSPYQPSNLILISLNIIIKI